MPVRTRAAATAVSAALLTLAVAAPAAATTPAWSVTHETAHAEGARRITSGPSSPFQLTLTGTLTNTGAGCYAVWTQFQYDLVPGPPFKAAALCGPGTAEINVVRSIMPTTTGTIFICKGMESPVDCGPRKYV
ncbi:hypothetical protein AB0A69_10395 [Streptomyces sp. NPDC045431]|uniref:hypothetical protein n=1 Tax=Streptomyces sp. NPDC045431 TaxID=3155613 RepID=UPI0033C33437